MTAYVLHDNVLDYSTTGIGYLHKPDDSGNAHDWTLYDSWKPNTTAIHTMVTINVGQYVAPDCLAIFGHNIGSQGCEIEFYSSNNGGTSKSLIKTITPTNDAPIFEFFTIPNGTTGQTANWFQVRIIAPTTALEIYHIQIGKALKLKPLGTGFKPPMYETYTATNNVNRQGTLLGRSVRKSARKMTISQKAITPTEMETDFVPWLEHASKLPFLFCWDFENRPEDTVFCWLEKNAPDPVYSNLCYLSLQMKVQALYWREIPER